jgi:hypothetical protein
LILIPKLSLQITEQKGMNKLKVIPILLTAVISLVLYEGAQAQGGMETRDTRIGKLAFENGYPDHETLERLYDERDFQRACQAYIGYSR